MESKKRAERRRACDLRKKAAAAEEERVRAAEQLLELQTLAKTTLLQDQQAQAMLFYGHAALGQHMIIPGTGAASGGSSASSVTRPLPPRSTAPPTTPFGHEMGAHSGRQAYQSRDGSPEGLTQAAAAQARARRVSKRTANYTEKEDKVLVDGWLTIGQDALTGAEQKGTAFWRRIYEYFHEHRKYGQEPFESDRSEISLQKRWGAIQTECNKFQAAYDNAKRIPVSGMGVKDLVWRALEFYKVNNGEKTFAFPHCWKELHGTPKFQEGYEGYMATLTGNNPAKDATVIDLDGGQPCGSSASRASRPRGHKSTKADMKRDASSMLLYGTLKEMHADREVSTDKRDERRRREKEEDRKKFFDVQQKKLEIEEVKAKTKAKELELKERELELIAMARAKEVELKAKEVELKRQAEDNLIMNTDLTNMSEAKRDWFEKRQKEILERPN
nr:glutathione S-transferase T3-like [Lolium perenne]